MNWFLFSATFLTATFAGYSLHLGMQNLMGDTETFLRSIIDFLHPANFAAGLPYSTAILAILGAHETGHYLACKRYGIPATLPFFIPGPPFIGTFGAVIRIRGIIPGRKALFDIAAAGPLAGFAVALPVMILGIYLSEPLPNQAAETAQGFFLGESVVSWIMWRLITDDTGVWQANPVYHAAWFGVLVTSLNLFPVGQLDGGHLAYAVSPRLHRYLSRTTIVILAAFVLIHGLYFWWPSMYTLWCVILIWMGDRHPMLGTARTELGGLRQVVVLILLLLFLVTFMPFPLM